jgi:hypothetical protein
VATLWKRVYVLTRSVCAEPPAAGGEHSLQFAEVGEGTVGDRLVAERPESLGRLQLGEVGGKKARWIPSGTRSRHDMRGI